LRTPCPAPSARDSPDGATARRRADSAVPRAARARATPRRATKRAAHGSPRATHGPPSRRCASRATVMIRNRARGREVGDAGAREIERDRDRHENVRARADRCAVEAGRRDADDRQRHVIDPENLAENAGIAAELALPIGVTQHDGLGMPVDSSVVRAEQAAESRPKTEHREIATGDERARGEARAVTGLETRLEEGMRREPDERLLFALEDAKHGVAEQH